MRAHRIVAASLLALTLCACSESTPPAPPAAPVIGPADEQTMNIVLAAQSYLASLTTAQMTASLFAFNDAEQRARWSSLPAGAFERKGVKWADLNDVQRSRLTDLLNAVLSADGVRMVAEQMAADEYLRDHPQDASPDLAAAPGAAASEQTFGSGQYTVAFLGSPSVTAPWMLQFGGHHLAINATIVGPHLTLAPSLTGGEPVRFGKDGKTIGIVDREAKAAQVLLDSLTPELREKAVMGAGAVDLMLGPGRDGYTLRPEGLQGIEMSPLQKEGLISLIETRIGLMNANDAAAAMAQIRKDIDQTWFAWFGPPEPAGGAYFRVAGPTVHMEFAPQDARPGEASNHVHSLYRDPTNDYGRAWAAIK